MYVSRANSTSNFARSRLIVEHARSFFSVVSRAKVVTYDYFRFERTFFSITCAWRDGNLNRALANYTQDGPVTQPYKRLPATQSNLILGGTQKNLESHISVANRAMNIWLQLYVDVLVAD